MVRGVRNILQQLFFSRGSDEAFYRAVFSCKKFTPEYPSIILGFKQGNEWKTIHDIKHFFQVRKASGE